jgi:hypothetical protein
MAIDNWPHIREEELCGEENQCAYRLCRIVLGVRAQIVEFERSLWKSGDTRNQMKGDLMHML